MTKEQKIILGVIAVTFVLLWSNRGNVLPKETLNVEPNDSKSEIEKALIMLKTGQIKVNSTPEEVRKEILNAK
jgi:hypothetical protein